MKKQELLRALLTSSMRSIIIESGSPTKSKATLITILKEMHCSYNFDSFCDNCKDCKRINKMEQNIHPDLIYFGGQLFSIKDARDLMRYTTTSPMEFSTRYIVFDVDKYSVESQNAILKIIEEDSDFEANAKFIFIVRSASSLLGTIQSRSVVISLESNSTREFENLCSSKKFLKKEFVAYICSYKEINLNKAVYLREKFSLNIEDLSEKISKMFRNSEISTDFFTTLEELKAYPYLYVFKAVEYDFVLNSKSNLYVLSEFYSLFYKRNYNRSKHVRDNLSVLLRMWYFINKREFFNEYNKE